jgi:hypothetical protein
MAGDHFSSGQLPHIPEGTLPDSIYKDVERNIVYACTDVALRNPSTGEIFLGTRQTEPQLGRWLIGGRNQYDASVIDNASLQVKNDLGIDITPGRFKFISSYSTTFPIAAPGREDHGRHTLNSVMLAELTDEEVQLLNEKIKNHQISDEYSGGGWFNPDKIAQKDSDFPDLLKSFIRDLRKYDRSYEQDWTEAIEENQKREKHETTEDINERLKRSSEILQNQFAVLTPSESLDIVQKSGDNSQYAIRWARTVSSDTPVKELAELLDSILNKSPYIGDYVVRKLLASNGIIAPEVYSDNGPTMRSILHGARLALEINTRHNGELFEDMPAIRFIGRAGVGPMDPQ